MLYKFLKFVLAPFFRLFYLVSVEGRENEPEGNFITIANHSSYVDPVLLVLALKKTQRFVARSTLSRFAFYRWLFKHIRVISIKRGKNDVRALRSITAAIKDGDCVGIFPQGTRVKGVDPKPEQAEAGLGLIATMTEVPVLPVAVITKSRRPRIFRRTRIIIGKPIYKEEYSGFMDDPRSKEIAEYCFARVCAPFGTGEGS